VRGCALPGSRCAYTTSGGRAVDAWRKVPLIAGVQHHGGAVCTGRAPVGLGEAVPGFQFVPGEKLAQRPRLWTRLVTGVKQTRRGK
jgi:hypothetical protein